MQCAVIEWARNTAQLEDANSAEFDPDTTNPVINLLPEQQDVVDLGGTMRLGFVSVPCQPRHPRFQTLSERSDLRAAPPPLRI